MLLFSLTLALYGCSGDDPKDSSGGSNTPPGDSEDTPSDSNPGDSTTGDSTTGDSDPGDSDPPVSWDALPAVYGVPNLDDDDENGTGDFSEARADDNEISTLTLEATLFADVAPDSTIELVLTEANPLIRIWQDGAVLFGDGVTTATMGPPTGDLVLGVEFGDYLTAGTLQLRELDSTGVERRSGTVSLLAAPLILNHHLQAAEHVWALAISGFGYSNDAFIETYTSVLGDRFTPLDDGTYQWDVWVQDELEFGTLTAPDIREDVVVDSIRDRGLDDFPERELEAPDTLVQTWGRGNATSQDSFGNLEVTPPLTADGVEYPFGRIYYGANGYFSPTEDLTDFLTSQKVQKPFSFDTSWLCVGHVDEFTSFVPDPTAPRGFRFIIADVASAWTILEGLDPEMSLPQYRDHGYDTVGELTGDEALRALNEDIQADNIDPILQTFIDELDLTDEEIVRVPSLFEEVRGCGGSVAALIPGSINLIVANFEGETPHIFLADPFFRTDVADQSADPIIAAITALLPTSLSLHFVDDWDVYHLGLGEVHCGTNVQRTPAGDWWTTALHLLEE